jgi:hypothetical protein
MTQPAMTGEEVLRRDRLGKDRPEWLDRLQVGDVMRRGDGTGIGTQGRAGGENLQTQAGGALNPAFPCWLMGFPDGWESYGASATRSSRKSPPSS